jgi:peptide/nickel transport system ATP-binding protein
MTAVLDVSDLTIRSGDLELVSGVSFSLAPGERLGIIGESGSGKSLTALSAMGLLPDSLRAEGSIRLDGVDGDPLSLPERDLARVRGGRISMVFQEPMTALNPLQRVGAQVQEVLKLHRRDGGDTERTAVELLERVRLPEPAAAAKAYPHQLSGGQRQRVMIAMALACEPELLIADEPTTALDMTIQAQILDLMRDLKRRVGAAIILITHDLGVVAEVAERVMVMYAGRKVEEAPVARLFRSPRHPYTQGLLGAVPKLGSSLTGTSTRLTEIPGLVPSLNTRIEGCVFASRCVLATDLCRQIAPPLELKAPGHVAACHYAQRELAAA